MGEKRSTGIRWGDVLVAAVAAVSWALIAMAGTAALGLHLLGADSAGSLGPMAAAVVALAVGGSVRPSGEVSAFGLEGAEAQTAIDIAPLGVGLVGALVLSLIFLRSLRGAGVAISGGELAARAGALAALFVAMVGGLAWVGHDVITIDGGALGLDDVPGGGGLGDIPGGAGLPDGIADRLPDGLGDIGGLLPDRLGDLVQAEASVGFTVNAAESLSGGAGWVLGVVTIALLTSRRAPLPRGWDVLHRVVRPAASALVTVVLVAVLAGLAAAAYAAVGDGDPKRIAGAALLGAPNGVWMAVPIGLFVPWEGAATGELAKLLPDPLDELLRVSAEKPVTVGRLAELDGRVWLLAVATALLMLYAGVLTAVRTPRPPGLGATRFAGACALRVGVVTALALPLLVWLTGVSVGASLSVLGFDAFGAGIELHGSAGTALLLGAVWGAGAGALGALLACATGAAGGRVAPLARGGRSGWGDRTYPGLAYQPGPYTPSPGYRPSHDETNPYLRAPDDWYGAPTAAGPALPPSPRARRTIPPPAPGPQDGHAPPGRPRPRTAAPGEEGPPPPGTPRDPR
ncbi:streptophobe family protein [Streptomyces sp. NPDC051219]|uniref:streptophobe family protein n=1 Tax=Streptomyces sp. NPDC051219 TaxID=3155283 RepID=UPI00342D9196